MATKKLQFLLIGYREAVLKQGRRICLRASAPFVQGQANFPILRIYESVPHGYEVYIARKLQGKFPRTPTGLAAANVLYASLLPQAYV